MKIAVLASLLAATAIAAPTEMLEARQAVGNTANELEIGACRPLILIFARGSTQPGNLGDNLGPATCNQLKSAYGVSRVACQGVGGPYSAGLLDNFAAEGTTTAAINEGIRLYNLARSKCPNSKVVSGGYSQGAAVVTGAVRRLSAASKTNLVGIVMYGSTRTDEEDNADFLIGGRIPNYPAGNTLNICAPDDGVCDGGLDVTAGHSGYLDDVPTAVGFLRGRVSAAGGV
ncbi:Putative cutinase/acetylxylan esterase, alpha/Beta hydrolase, cutinase, serine active [Septoria linicola]|uniref:Cutinase n=1 Tax=Septoria linicola TaxID=215465 RepID=A0A9Q9AU07_9PEZI|nr:Putative cutinase/acetylxylan esterase, alpha/Beta hydrolase, cutinase, serine active [Septoria linicola]